MSDLPSLALIYNLSVKNTYDSALLQANRMDDKIQSILATSGILTFTMLVASTSLQLCGGMLWIAAILGIAVVEGLVLLIGRFVLAKGNVECLDPKELYDKLAKLEQDDAMASLIVGSSESFNHNMQKIITPRWRCAFVLSCLLVAKLIVFASWVLLHSLSCLGCIL